MVLSVVDVCTVVSKMYGGNDFFLERSPDNGEVGTPGYSVLFTWSQCASLTVCLKAITTWNVPVGVGGIERDDSTDGVCMCSVLSPPLINGCWL